MAPIMAIWIVNTALIISSVINSYHTDHITSSFQFQMLFSITAPINQTYERSRSIIFLRNAYPIICEIYHDIGTYFELLETVEYFYFCQRCYFTWPFLDFYSALCCAHRVEYDNAGRIKFLVKFHREIFQKLYHI